MKRTTLAALVAAAVTSLTSPAYALADPLPVQPFVPGINEDPGLLAAWQDWQAKGIDDYVVTVRFSCFCPPEPAVRTVVRDDAVRRVSQGERRLRAGRGWSMDELFTMLREAKAEADSVEVDFSSRGVPTSIAIDFSRKIADEERYYTVSLSRL